VHNHDECKHRAGAKMGIQPVNQHSSHMLQLLDRPTKETPRQTNN
jgi:hypothetical protein